MSEVNIDARLVADGGAQLSRTQEQLVVMSNGCICCTLRDDLLDEVRRLSTEGRFDYLLIESTGDRRQEIVLIGHADTMDESFLKECFDACLLTDEEMELGEASWSDLQDPLPKFE